LTRARGSTVVSDCIQVKGVARGRLKTPPVEQPRKPPCTDEEATMNKGTEAAHSVSFPVPLICLFGMALPFVPALQDRPKPYLFNPRFD